MGEEKRLRANVDCGAWRLSSDAINSTNGIKLGDARGRGRLETRLPTCLFLLALCMRGCCGWDAGQIASSPLTKLGPLYLFLSDGDISFEVKQHLPC